MPNLSIKQVPEHLAEKLRRQAASNHRSLQGELMSILFQALEPEGMPATRPSGIRTRKLSASWLRSTCQTRSPGAK